MKLMLSTAALQRVAQGEIGGVAMITHTDGEYRCWIIINFIRYCWLFSVVGYLHIHEYTNTVVLIPGNGCVQEYRNVVPFVFK